MTFVSVEFVEIAWKLTVNNRSMERGHSLNQQKVRPDEFARVFPERLKSQQFVAFEKKHLDRIIEEMAQFWHVPDCHHGTTGSDSQRVGYAVSR